MEDWFRRLLVLIVFVLWAAYMFVNGIVRHENIPEALWMVPTAAWVTFYPKFKWLSKRGDTDNVDSD